MSEQAKHAPDRIYFTPSYFFDVASIRSVPGASNDIVYVHVDVHNQILEQLSESQQAIAGLTSAANRVCGQRDALLTALKEIRSKISGHVSLSDVDAMDAAIASIESNQPISTPMSERERELVNASRVVSEWAEKYSPTDSCGSEDTGAWLSSDGQEAIDGLRKSLSNYQEV